jgi:hypothetical protein
VSRRHLVAALFASTVGVVLALVLAGSSHGLALLAYVLFVGALGLAVLAGRLRAALPEAPRFEGLLARETRPGEPIGQLETIVRTLSGAEWIQAELHYRLRPLVREIAAARLSRRHGVDLDRQPERARALIGEGRVWELVRPEREPPEERHARGWSRAELEELIDELERV